jgi:hypothetical protein
MDKELLRYPWVERGEDGRLNYFFCPGALVLDLHRNRVIVSHEEGYFVEGGGYFPGLYAIDISTGERSLVSGEDRGTGPGLRVSPGRLFMDTDGEHVIAIAANSV